MVADPLITVEFQIIAATNGVSGRVSIFLVTRAWTVVVTLSLSIHLIQFLCRVLPASDPKRLTLQKQTPLLRGSKASLIRGELIATWLGVLDNNHNPLQTLYNWAIFTPDCYGGYDTTGVHMPTATDRSTESPCAPSTC